MAEDQLQRLVEAAACGTHEAWAQLWRRIEPDLWALVDRPRFASHLAHTEEARRRIITTVRAQLAANRGHALQRYLDARRRNPRLDLVRWLALIAKRAALSYATRDEPGDAILRRPSARRMV